MEELALIEELDRWLQEWTDDFLAALVAVNTQLLEALDVVIDSMTLRGRSTTNEEYRANLRRAITIRNEIEQLVLGRTSLNTLVQSLVTNMGKSVEQVNLYYASLIKDFNPETYQEFLSSVTQQYRQNLTTGVIEGIYTPVLGEVINTHAMTRSTNAELRAVLRAKLAENGVVTKYVHQQASDALYTYSRAYSMAVAEDLNLRHYYYMGTEIATTRRFCSSRIAKAYTQSEVESWALLNWNGKIPGTTKQSIFWLCGGYNCRHRLMPISKELYNQFQLKQQINVN